MLADQTAMEDRGLKPTAGRRAGLAGLAGGAFTTTLSYQAENASACLRRLRAKRPAFRSGARQAPCHTLG